MSDGQLYVGFQAVTSQEVTAWNPRVMFMSSELGGLDAMG